MKTIPSIFICSLLILAVACGKDKFETKPLIEIKSYNLTELLPGDPLIIRINFFDKEGDLNQGMLQVRKKRLNRFPPVSPSDFLEDSIDYILPEFPAKDKGEITFQTDYSRLDESQGFSDTVQYTFAVMDLAGNTSDTITSAVIVAVKP